MFTQKKLGTQMPGLHKINPKQISIELDRDSYHSIEGAAIVVLKAYVPERGTALTLVLKNLDGIDENECKLVRYAVVLGKNDFQKLLDPSLKVRFHTKGGSVLFESGKVIRDSMFFEEPLHDTINRLNEKN